MHEARILNTSFTDLHLCLENYAQNMLHIRGYYSSYSLKRRLLFSVVLKAGRHAICSTSYKWITESLYQAHAKHN